MYQVFRKAWEIESFPKFMCCTSNSKMSSCWRIMNAVDNFIAKMLRYAKLTVFYFTRVTEKLAKIVPDSSFNLGSCLKYFFSANGAYFKSPTGSAFSHPNTFTKVGSFNCSLPKSSISENVRHKTIVHPVGLSFVVRQLYLVVLFEVAW